MDFISRRIDDLSQTARLYGEESSQYDMHKRLLDIEESFRSSGRIALGKECNGEYIVQVFNESEILPGYVNHKTKYYFDKDTRHLRNEKHRKIKDVRTIKDIVTKEIFDLIVNHNYHVVDLHEYISN